MSSKQIQYVLVLAKEGSFARAADELGISQPSLSQYIKKIEQQVGAELFDRTGGNVRLTDAGRAYAEVGREILNLEHELQTRLSDVSLHKSGSLVVGTSPYRSAAMMPKVARAFRRLYPGMHLVVEEMTSAELLDAAEHGRFDLCLTVMPVNERIFTWERVAEEELILAVPAAFPSLKAERMPGRKYPAVDAVQLDGCGFITITASQVMQRELDNLCADYGLKIEKAAVVKSLEAQIAMVRGGVGMALVPTGIETFCAEGEVSFYSFRQELPRREVVAMWRKDRSLSGVTEELLKLMKEILK